MPRSGNDDGPGLLEVLLILVVILAAALAGLTFLGPKLW
jgi:hypothetical protein